MEFFSPSFLPVLPFNLGCAVEYGVVGTPSPHSEPIARSRLSAACTEQVHTNVLQSWIYGEPLRFRLLPLVLSHVTYHTNSSLFHSSNSKQALKYAQTGAKGSTDAAIIFRAYLNLFKPHSQILQGAPQHHLVRFYIHVRSAEGDNTKVPKS